MLGISKEVSKKLTSRYFSLILVSGYDCCKPKNAESSKVQGGGGGLNKEPFKVLVFGEEYIGYDSCRQKMLRALTFGDSKQGVFHPKTWYSVRNIG